MRRIIHGSTSSLRDVDAFVERLAGDDAPERDAPFPPGRDVIVTRAPGRSLVFGDLPEELGVDRLLWPVGAGTVIALQRDPQRQLQVVAGGSLAGQPPRRFELPLHHLQAEGRPVAYQVAREYFARYDDRAWAAPIIGTFLVLMRERGVRFVEGARLVVQSTVPEALAHDDMAPLAVARAICAEANMAVDARGLTRLVAIAGRELAGWPDRGAELAFTARAVAQQAMLVRAADDLVHVPLGDTLDLVTAVVPLASRRGGEERERRFVTALRLAEHIARRAGVLAPDPGRPQPHPPAAGRALLTEVDAESLDARVLPILPEEIDGSAAIALVGGDRIGDLPLVTRASYRPRAAAAYLAGEQRRAREFTSRPSGEPEAARALRLGGLLTSAHESARRADLSTSLADTLVDLTRAAVAHGRALGGRARTAGDAVVLTVLVRAGDAPVAQLRDEIEQQTGSRPLMVAGSSPGVMRFGYLRLRGY